jgi:predicted O-methyltransferase YrrM
MEPNIEIEKLKAMMNLKEGQQVFDIQNFLAAPRFDAAARAAFVRPNLKLAHALFNSQAKGLPPISVLPLAGQHLSILAQTMGVKSVLEVGTLGGYSAICFAGAGAKVTSVEINPKHRDVALENVEGLDVEILLGAAEDVLPKLAEEGRKFDMVFIDADFDHQWTHFDWAVKLTRPKGCVFLDDVVVSMWKNGQAPEDEESVLAKVGKDERVVATLVPIVASHPMLPTPVFNGFIIAMVK